MNANEVRDAFLTFFKKKHHEIVPSAPIVLKSDPSLMFTNAGMNQFKDFFLGNKRAAVSRVADTQKCLRVSGKHNDLEEVGFDTYHHTMFEMLGNWSFGDYFKKEAIEWAWELLTEVYRLSPDRLYATIFEGDASENLARDQEAFDFWKQFLPEDRILDGAKKDNFWEMGDSGPCGPCSEIHIDLRAEEERQAQPGQDLVNKDHPLVVEIWNLVFMQFNRMANRSLQELPQTHVDTGMGFERLVMAIQGKTSNYDTDVFQPLIQRIASLSGTTYGRDESTDVALRVVADHIRAISFTIADGQLPGNAKAGYVIRRILRRAVRYGHTYLGFREPFMHELVPTLVTQFEKVFPELGQQAAFVAKVIREEEAAFLNTLDRGLKRLSAITEKSKTIDGTQAFELYDTYGFPLDLTLLIAREQGAEVDIVGFESEMKAQKVRSKQDTQETKSDWVEVQEGAEPVFIGYDSLDAPVELWRYREMEEKGKKTYQVVLGQTPFYAEGGGQVGDTGWLIQGEQQIPVLDTQKENDLIIHRVPELPKELQGTLRARVNEENRMRTCANHSVTHLMHAALREVLGHHVQQRGSLVNARLTRFDFSHFAKMTPEEIHEVEQLVNEKIRENIPLDERRNVPIDQAREMGAMALFGEKYGDVVRVITFDPNYSVELCGGTHVPATGHIGYFKIIGESSVAAGVRRLEAVTSAGALHYIETELDMLNQIRSLFKHPAQVVKSVEDLIQEKHELEKELNQLRQGQTNQVKGDISRQLSQAGEVPLAVQQVSVPTADGLKQLSFELKKEVPGLILLLGAVINNKPQLSLIMDERWVEKGLNAGQLIREIAKNIQGGGGGQPFYATAGGKNKEGLTDALNQGRELIAQQLNLHV